MSNPSKNGMPGAGGMADPLDFVKRLWGGMAVPGMTVPTVSVDELNQKIADLKAVENWLNMNMSMLRSTIQAMEVQSATLTTIQSMGAMMGAALKPGDGKDAFSAFGFPGANPSGKDAAQQSPSASPFSYPNWPAPAPKPGAATAGPAPSVPSPSPTPDDNTSTGKTAAAPSGMQPDFSSAMAAPSAWWNMLQNQFMQAVTQAMADNPVADGEGNSPAAAAGSATPKAGEAKPEGGAKKGMNESSAADEGKRESGARPARKPKA